MVAYSFKAQFELPIRAGTKIGTIRAAGKRRHAAPGNALQLYTGMRTKSCRLIARAQCQFVDPIVILAATSMVWSAGKLLHGRALDDFAQGDGFGNFAQMRAFWIKEHADKAVFRGVWIRWAPESLVEAP